MHLILYNCGLVVAITLALPYYLCKGLTTGKYFGSWRERLGRLRAEVNPEQQRSIWIHAVSVGEVLVARPLLAPIKQQYPQYRLILTTTTRTGQALARRTLAGQVDAICYAPLDWPAAVNRALAIVNPALLVLVETELWPNLIHAAHRRGTKVALINGRISPRSFPRYRRVRAWLRPVLAEIDLLLMQAEAHADRIVAIGAPKARVRTVGNLKYDCLGDGCAAPSWLRADTGVKAPLFVAGSTVEGEEAWVLGAFRQARAIDPRLRLLLAPRHPERFDEVFRLITAQGWQVARRTSMAPCGWASGDVLLLDTIGELASVYTAAAVVFVGGSLVARGGHNILEAAVAGKAVIVGPHMENFQEIADAFLAQDALVQIAHADDLAATLLSLLEDAARREAIGARARALIEHHRGAGERTLGALKELLS
ncbi:MAG: 3-deoxy-D-manno-octulosonic acid transferase [Vicinamibacteria bacterium]|nr:3-deoxy-D-manno-octulosonic acid transferase [Vicinamibacteria bacterium]